MVRCDVRFMRSKMICVYAYKCISVCICRRSVYITYQMVNKYVAHTNKITIDSNKCKRVGLLIDGQENKM